MDTDTKPSETKPSSYEKPAAPRSAITVLIIGVVEPWAPAYVSEVRVEAWVRSSGRPLVEPVVPDQGGIRVPPRLFSLPQPQR